MVQLGKEDKPRGIDLDVCEGMVYWTNWNRRHPAIQRAYYSGFNRQDLITENVHMPNGLALDLAERKLYWADARLDKIEVKAFFFWSSPSILPPLKVCGLDGSDCQALAKSLAVHPFDLAVYKVPTCMGKYVMGSYFRTISSSLTGFCKLW